MGYDMQALMHKLHYAGLSCQQCLGTIFQIHNETGDDCLYMCLSLGAPSGLTVTALSIRWLALCIFCELHAA